MRHGKALYANSRKAMILSSQIWGLAQRSIPNFRRHGNRVWGVSGEEGFVNRRVTCVHVQRPKKVSAIGIMLYIV